MTIFVAAASEPSILENPIVTHIAAFLIGMAVAFAIAGRR